MRDRPRIATAFVAFIALALAAVGLFVLRGSDDGTDVVAAEIEAEEIEKFEREAEEQVATTATTERERTTTTRRPTTTQPATTVPPSTAPNADDSAATDSAGPDEPDDSDANDDEVDDGSETGDEPISEVTTTQPEATETGESRIIRELTTPVTIYASPALDAEVVGALGISVPLDIKERKDGWYRIESGDVIGWVFGAYVVPSPDPDFQSVISIDGSTLQPQYADGELVPDAYEPGKYAFGFVEPDGSRTLIFLPDGLVVYIPTNQVRPVQ